MASFVLVHGAWQAGWCWQLLVPLLNQKGHQVSTPDLPGHGSNIYPLSEVTYDLYYKSLERELMQHKEPIVLVAHSMAGLMAAQLLDQYPEKISHLYLIAAFVAQDGESLFDIVTQGGESNIPGILIENSENNTQSLDLQKVRQAFYHQCSPEIADWAIANLQPQPIAPFATPIHWKASGTTLTKRTYILCEKDLNVPKQTQLNVIKRYPCKMKSIHTCHFPFLSAPNELMEIITSET
jgi:pimeloyl-ACP methyl ester carboxylesterase